MAATMKVWMVLVALVVSTFFVASKPLQADEGDKAAIEQVITQQIEAFRRDDGATAYSFAAPGIQRIYPSADSFMSMVKRGYRPVYRPRDFSFGDLRVDGPRRVQDVRITGPDGRGWIAVYALQQFDDGMWRIIGVQLVELPGAEV